MTLDLTKKPNCYVNKIVNMKPTVEDLYKAPHVTVTAMQEAVKRAVLLARPTEARARFLDRLSRCGTKWEIHELCYNSVNCGRNYQC